MQSKDPNGLFYSCLLVLVPIWLLAGCSETRSVTYTDTKKEYDLSDPKTNDELSGKYCEIELTDGNTLPAQIIDVRLDSVHFIQLLTHDHSAVLTKDVRRITTYNHFAGGLQGIFVGTLSGAVIGGGIGFLVSKTSANSSEYGPGFGALILGFGGGLVGGVAGLLYGSIHGSGEVYEFPK